VHAGVPTVGGVVSLLARGSGSTGCPVTEQPAGWVLVIGALLLLSGERVPLDVTVLPLCVSQPPTTVIPAGSVMFPPVPKMSKASWGELHESMYIALVTVSWPQLSTSRVWLSQLVLSATKL
jgi:hypothetical protein